MRVDAAPLLLDICSRTYLRNRILTRMPPCATVKLRAAIGRKSWTAGSLPLQSLFTVVRSSTTLIATGLPARTVNAWSVRPSSRYAINLLRSLTAALAVTKQSPHKRHLQPPPSTQTKTTTKIQTRSPPSAIRPLTVKPLTERAGGASKSKSWIGSQKISLTRNAPATSKASSIRGHSLQTVCVGGQSVVERHIQRLLS